MKISYIKEGGQGHHFFHYLLKRKTSLFTIVVSFILFVSVSFSQATLFSKQDKESVAPQNPAGAQVQGIEIRNMFLPTPTDMVEESQSASTASLTATPTPTPPATKKSFYTIAVIGDSMVDTMGERMEYLEGALKKKYPNTRFFLYNYGRGSEHVETGLARFGEDFKYNDRSFPALSQLDTDIIIVGSFAYNPFSPHDRDKHWLTLTKLVHEAKKTGADIYLLAEIAPVRGDFGKGPGGVNWSDNTIFLHTGYIIEQLENTVGLSKALHIPLINAFDKTIKNQRTREGTKEYVNTFDNIHPSVKGHEFMAHLIAETLKID